MKVQVAIDRVSLEDAVAFASQVDGKVDLIEMGTSLVKDYGNLAIKKLKEVVKTSELLVDSKTIDEGAYEFEQGFRFGADVLTVMGAASVDTLRICYDVAQRTGKTMMIDLLEVEEAKVRQISDFSDAIYALHHSIDRKDQNDVVQTVATFHQHFPMIDRLAVAGGIDLKQAKELKEQGLVEVVIVGSKITKATDPMQAVNEFMEAVHK